MIDLGFIGTSGRVTAAIPPGGEGEVMLRLPTGGTQTFAARAVDGSDEFKEGTLVWVSDQSGRTVYVVGA